MFSCNTIPDNDDYSRDYVCGSRNLNDSLVVFVTIFAIIAVLLVLFVTVSRFITGKHYRFTAALRSKGDLVWTYLTYLRSLDTRGLKYSPAVRKIGMLSDTFVLVMQNAVQLLVVILAGSMVLYLVKALDSSDAYATHSHTYAWFWTLAYMRGVVPAGLLLMLWTGAISACFGCIVLFPRRSGGSSVMAQKTAVPSAASGEIMSFTDQAVSVGAAFVFNACVTIVVNTLYIYSTQQALGFNVHLCIQLSLSIFRLVYVTVAFPLLSRPIQGAVDNVRFRFILLTINNLLIPCIVTALTSDACFQVAIVMPVCLCFDHHSVHVWLINVLQIVICS